MMSPDYRGTFRIAPAEFLGRVLIVDDEALVCWSLATGLRQAGFVAETAATAAEAIRAAGSRPHPDAIVLDSRLHDCDASMLIRELRAVAPTCRFLVMTTDRHDVPAGGYDGLIVRKPFDLPDVVRQVATEVQRARVA